MATLAVVWNEFVLVMYYVMLVTGIVVWVGGPALLIMSFCWVRQIDFGTNDFAPLDEELPDANGTAEILCEHPAAIDIITECQVHQRMLKFYYNELCQRAGCDPNEMSPMTDLIAEAVFDGRKRKECITELNKIAALEQKGSPQHA